VIQNIRQFTKGNKDEGVFVILHRALADVLYGDSNKIMSETLGITLDTTKKHVRNVIDKLQARSRTHAAIIAAQSGILGNPITNLVAKTEPSSKA
jgi:hypothetical protein